MRPKNQKNIKTLNKRVCGLYLEQEQDERAYSIQLMSDDDDAQIHGFICLILLFLSWSTFWILYCLQNNIYNKYYILIYILFSFWYNLLKNIFTRIICRKIDTIRYLNNSKCKSLTISFEYLFNWIFICVYWNWLRILIGCHTPNLSSFIISICLHALIELFEINIRLTRYYFNYRMYFVNIFSKKSDLFETFIDTKNSFIEWKCRLSMDIILKFYASILNVILVALGIYGYGPTFFEAMFGLQTYNKALSYTLISTAVDIIYFLITFYFHKKYYKFSIITSFVEYINKFSKCQLIFYFFLTIFFFANLQK